MNDQALCKPFDYRRPPTSYEQSRLRSQRSEELLEMNKEFVRGRYEDDEREASFDCKGANAHNQKHLGSSVRFKPPKKREPKSQGHGRR